MKVVVTSNGVDLDAAISPVFGRCSTYILVDTETMQFEALSNPALSAPGGAGIQAAQFVIERGAEAVVTGNVGPNAFKVLQALGVPVYLSGGGTVREAIDAYKIGRLRPMEEANVPTHSGTTRGTRVGAGQGTRLGRRSQDAVLPALPTSFVSREQEITVLRETARELRERLAQVLERLGQLEKEVR